MKTTNGVWPPARNRFPPFAVSQQTTYSAVSLSEATRVPALHVTVAHVHMSRSAFLARPVDRGNETASDKLVLNL